MQSVFSAQSFQNNLLKADLYKSSLGGVKLTLYTNKPYNDSLVVNKKSDFEYVILLPETANSLTAKPALSSVSDTVKSMDIKTQQYENQLKGYTKITILTTKPTEITPYVEVLNTSINEKEYKELLTQTAKKHEVTTKIAANQKSPQVSKAKAPVLKTAELKPPALRTYTFKKSVLPQKIKQPQIVSKPKVIVQQRPIVQEKRAEVKAPGRTPEVIAPYVKSSMKQEAKAPEIQKYIYTPETKTESKPEVQTPTPSVAEVSPPPVKKNTTAKPIGRFHKYKNILKNNLYVILGLIFAIFILLLLVLKKINKNYSKQKASFVSHLNDKPLPTVDYTQNISEDMSWKEKFQTYVEASTPPVDASTQVADKAQDQIFDIEEKRTESPVENKALDELFLGETLGNDIDKEPVIQDLPKNITEEYQTIGEPELVNETQSIEETESFDDEMSEYEIPQFEGTSDIDDIDELFGEEDILENLEEEDFDDTQVKYSDEEPEQFQVEAQESDKYVKSEFAIDDEKGFYLVDFENKTALVGHIDEEIFVLKRFDKKIEGTLQARIDEKNGNRTSYMTKIGSFRGLVEVTPKNMNLLIEL